MLLVAIDPGIKGCGVAFFRHQELLEAAYVGNAPVSRSVQPDPTRLHEILTMADELVSRIEREHLEGETLTLALEWPQVYSAGKGRGNPNDLLPLAGIGAASAACLLMAYPGLVESHTYLPRAWKGTIDPEVMTRRVRARLGSDEFERVHLPGRPCAPCQERLTSLDCSKSTCLAHNVYDAIGIGLKHLGRLEAHKVITR